MVSASWVNFFKTKADVMALIACLLVTYGAWQVGVNRDNSEQAKLSDTRFRLERVIGDELDFFRHNIPMMNGLYLASESVSEDELSSFVGAFALQDKHEVIESFHFVSLDPESDNPNITLGTNGEIYPARGTELVEGVNLDELPSVMSLDSKLLVDDRQDKMMAYYYPVQKQDSLVGVIVAIFDQDELEHEIEELVGANTSWNWYDSEGQVIAERELEIMGSQVDDQASIPLYDDSFWTIDIARQKIPSPLWNIILVIGIFSSFLVFTLVYGLISANARVEEMARQITQDLQKYRLALESSSNHMIITDTEGIILYANQAAQDLTGFSYEEMKGQTPRLWGRQMNESFYKLMWKTIKDDRQVFKGIIRNMKKNGEVYEANASIAPIIDKATNELLGFVGVELDVTESNRLMRELSKRNLELTKLMDLTIEREGRIKELKKRLEEKG